MFVAVAWGPTLVFVLAGTVVTAMLGFRPSVRRSASWFGGPLCLPGRRDIDRPLILGVALFGAGWGSPGIAPDRVWLRWFRLPLTRSGSYRGWWWVC